MARGQRQSSSSAIGGANGGQQAAQLKDGVWLAKDLHRSLSSLRAAPEQHIKTPPAAPQGRA